MCSRRTWPAYAVRKDRSGSDQPGRRRGEDKSGKRKAVGWIAGTTDGEEPQLSTVVWKDHERAGTAAETARLLNERGGGEIQSDREAGI